MGFTPSITDGLINHPFGGGDGKSWVSVRTPRHSGLNVFGRGSGSKVSLSGNPYHFVGGIAGGGFGSESYGTTPGIWNSPQVQSTIKPEQFVASVGVVSITSCRFMLGATFSLRT